MMFTLANKLFQQPWPSGEFRFFQLAWVVDDLFAAAQEWVDTYGIGPFHVMHPKMRNVQYRGQPGEIDMKFAVAQSGPVQIELIQQLCDSPSVYRDIYPRGTSGLHHMGTIISKYDETKAHYEKAGSPLIGEVTGQNGQRVGYFDTTKTNGLVTEAIEESEAFKDAVANISKTCASWDGKDPIRILTREGYKVP